MKTIDRYILKEVISTFLFGLAIFSTLFIASSLLFQIANMIVEKHVALSLVIAYFFNRLPQIFMYVLPMSTLLGVLLGMGKLSVSLEITAMKAGGISFLRLSTPVLIFAFIISLFGAIINQSFVPNSNFRANNILYEQIEKHKGQMLENIVLKNVNSQGIERITYARSYDPKQNILNGTIISDFYHDKLIRLIYAKKARWINNNWQFEDGKSYEFNKESQLKNITSFKEAVFNLNTKPINIISRQKRPDEMTTAELKEKIKNRKKGKIKTEKLQVQYYLKSAIPFACFVFALIGISFSQTKQRTASGAVGLGISLIIIFVYYVFLFMGITLGNGGVIPPIIAAWFANIIFALVGLFFLLKNN